MEKELLKAIRSMLKEELQPMRDDINGVKDEINGIKGEVNGLKSEVNGIKGEVSGLKSEVNGIKSEVSGLKDDIRKLDIRLERVETKTDNNTILLENIDKKVQTLAEVQSSFQDQLGRAKENEERSLTDRLEVIELAVTDTSSRVKDVQRDLGRVARVTGENWAEIIELKSIK